jgi:hypothetical protein
MYYCISVFMVAYLIYFCYIIGYTRYLCEFFYYISALISVENNLDQQWIGRKLLDVVSVWDHCDLMVEQGEDISGTQYNGGKVYSR